MSKNYPQSRKEKSQQESLQLKENQEANQFPGKKPPQLQLEASEASPIQREVGGLGASHEKDYEESLVARGLRGEKGVERGTEPDDPDFKAHARIAEGSTDLWGASTLSDAEKEENLKTTYAETAGKASGSIGSDGIKGKAEAEGSAKLIDYEREFPFTFEHNILGEDMEMFLALVVKGMVGAEAAASIEGKVTRAGAAKDGSGVNNSAFKAGIQAEASAFAGAKVSLGGKAAYRWKKKQQASYKEKISQSADMILDSILLINPPLGWLLKKMDSGKAIDFLCQALFGMGKEGTVDLGTGEAEVEGSAGVGGEAGAGMGFQNGKFNFYANAKATWGLGFGTKVKVGLDLVEGVLFGMVAGGELWSRAKNYIGDLIDPSALMGSLGSLWDGLTGWFSQDDQIREMVRAGAHTLAPVAERGRMLESLMSGWTGGDDQQAMLDILRFSAQNGDLSQVYAAAGGKNSVLSELDGNLNTQARSL